MGKKEERSKIQIQMQVQIQVQKQAEIERRTDRKWKAGKGKTWESESKMYINNSGEKVV